MVPKGKAKFCTFIEICSFAFLLLKLWSSSKSNKSPSTFQKYMPFFLVFINVKYNDKCRWVSKCALNNSALPHALRLLHPCTSALVFVSHNLPTSTVPDSAKLKPAPLPPLNPSAVPSASLSTGNGKRVPSGGQPQTAQQLQTLLQQRYLPREVPPRFRQQEHKQLLKRGQPLPSGSLPLTATGHPGITEPEATVAIHSSPSCSSSSTASLPAGQHSYSIHKSLCLNIIAISMCTWSVLHWLFSVLEYSICRLAVVRLVDSSFQVLHDRNQLQDWSWCRCSCCPKEIGKPPVIIPMHVILAILRNGK